jgi:actin-related protein 10
MSESPATPAVRRDRERTPLAASTSATATKTASPHYATSLRSRHSLYGTEDRVVLDLGSRCWKVGYSGEPFPRAVLDISEFGAGDEASLWDNAGLLTERVKEGLRKVFFDVLLADPKQRKVIVLENPLAERRVKETVAGILFGNLHVSSKSLGIRKSCHNRLTRAASGALTVLCICSPSRSPCGGEYNRSSRRYRPHRVMCCSGSHPHGCSIVCKSLNRWSQQIFSSRPLLPMLHTTPRAGLRLSCRLRALLLRFGSYAPPATLLANSSTVQPLPGPVPDDVLTIDLLEDIKARGCFVSDPIEDDDIVLESPRDEFRMDVDQLQADVYDEAADARLMQRLERRWARRSTASNVTLPVPGKGTLLIPGWVRERAAEVLFEPGDEDEVNVAEALLECLLKVSTDRQPVAEGC